MEEEEEALFGAREETPEKRVIERRYICVYVYNRKLKDNKQRRILYKLGLIYEPDQFRERERESSN